MDSAPWLGIWVQLQQFYEAIIVPRLRGSRLGQGFKARRCHERRFGQGAHARAVIVTGLQGLASFLFSGVFCVGRFIARFWRWPFSGEVSRPDFRRGFGVGRFQQGISGEILALHFSGEVL